MFLIYLFFDDFDTMRTPKFQKFMNFKKIKREIRCLCYKKIERYVKKNFIFFLKFRRSCTKNCWKNIKLKKK